MNETIRRHTSSLPRLEGGRVHLRAPCDGDQAALYSLFSLPQVVRFWSTPAWTDPAQADAWLRRQAGFREESTGLTWAIVRPDDDTLIGTASLYAFVPEQGRGEVGYTLHPRLWGSGLATDAVRRTLRFAFEELDLRRIEADTDPRNTGSCKLLERLGFEREGYLRERWFVDGELQDTALYGLLRRDLR